MPVVWSIFTISFNQTSFKKKQFKNFPNELIALILSNIDANTGSLVQELGWPVFKQSTVTSGQNKKIRTQAGSTHSTLKVVGTTYNFCSALIIECVQFHPTWRGRQTASRTLVTAPRA